MIPISVLKRLIELKGRLGWNRPNPWERAPDGYRDARREYEALAIQYGAAMAAKILRLDEAQAEQEKEKGA